LAQRQKNVNRKTRSLLPPLQTGQIWQMEDSNLQVELMGKLLVHYKLFRGNAKRARISLAGIEVVQNYLKKNNAVLRDSRTAD
jgi:hypothetical protein